MSTPNLPKATKMVVVSRSISEPTSCLEKDAVIEQEKGDSNLVDEEEVQEQSAFASAKTFLFLGRRRSLPRDLDAIATRRSVFDDPHLAPYYWPKKDYENIHRFDPSARWSYREEKVLVRKVDWKIMVVAIAVYFTLNLDRGDINQANSAGFLSNLHLTTDDFNLGNTVFHLAYLCVELPSQLIAKRFGPDRCIPIRICLWSIITMSQFWLTGKTSFLLCRTLLGLAQGGFVPQLVLYMSYFYTKTELPFRFACLWVSGSVCGIVASFLAYGILHLDGVSGKAGWRWLFLIEGLMTFAIGVTCFFNMPQSPTQTKAWFRPKGWLTEREEVIIVNKVLRDDPTKSDMHNREGLTLKSFWFAICNRDLWPVYILGFVIAIPSNPPGSYLTLLLRNAGKALAIVSTLLFALVSDSVRERTFMATTQNVWVLPFLVAMYALPSSPSPWLFFGLLTGLLSYPHTYPILVGMCSRNSGAVANRAINATLLNMFVEVSLIVSAQIYVASDAPRYERGNMILIVLCLVNILLLYPATKAYYHWRNRQRAKIWDAMTHEEKASYLETTSDVGNGRLDFRFVH